MKISKFIPILVLSVAFSGCNFMTNEERNIKEMVQTFLVAVQNNDADTANEILLDLKGFHTLNPDVNARVDASSFTEAVLSDLITNFRNMVKYFDGKEIKVRRFHLGSIWYQYKGFPAFKDTDITVTANGQTVEFTIRGIVKIDGKWRIVNLSDNGLF